MLNFMNIETREATLNCKFFGAKFVFLDKINLLPWCSNL